MKGNKVINVIAFVLAGIFLIFLAVALFGKSADNADRNKPTPTQEERGISESAMRENFMGGCKEGEERFHDYCECTYEYLMDELGKEGFVDFALDYSAEELSGEGKQVFYDAVRKCQPLIK